MLFIETASEINKEEEKFSFVFVKSKKENCFIGYTSLFDFYNPKYGKTILRICQMIVLPLFQREFHLGTKMMELIYKEARNDETVMEINVESPCEGSMKERRKRR